MRRDSKEGSEGFYSLKSTSNEQDESDDSFTVAFEDHADANNFCFLLQSFFEDLGSFSADAVPVSIRVRILYALSHYYPYENWNRSFTGQLYEPIVSSRMYNHV